MASRVPPMGVRANARRALAWVRDGLGGDGLTEGAKSRGRRLAAGSEMPVDWFKMAAAWFARHEVDKQAEGFSGNDDNYPSAGRVAWDLWGGDEGQAWAVKVRDQLERESEGREVRELPDNYRPALEEDVPEGRACGNCRFYDEENRDEDRAWCTRWEDYVRGDHYCNAWQADEENPDNDDTMLPLEEPRHAH